MTLRILCDPATDAAYQRFSESPVVGSERVAPGVVLDDDSQGRMVGLEVLEARRQLPADALIASE